jgi:hypothetical protein
LVTARRCCRGNVGHDTMSLPSMVFKASPRRQGGQKTEASWTPHFSRLILFSFSFPYFSPFPGIFLVIWRRLASPRLIALKIMLPRVKLATAMSRRRWPWCDVVASHAGNGVAEACWRCSCRVNVGCGVLSLSSLADKACCHHRVMLTMALSR